MAKKKQVPHPFAAWSTDARMDAPPPEPCVPEPWWSGAGPGCSGCPGGCGPAEFCVTPPALLWLLVLVGRHPGRGGPCYVSCVVEASGEAEARLKATRLKKRLMPRASGWRGVQVEVTEARPADVDRAMLGREEGPGDGE